MPNPEAHWRVKISTTAELPAVAFAVRYSVGEKQKAIYVFTDSWAVANAITIWCQKRAKTDFKINSRVVWSRNYWLELFKATKKINIYVTHISAH